MDNQSSETAYQPEPQASTNNPTLHGSNHELRRNWKYIAIVVVLGLVSVGGVLLLKTREPASSPTPSPTDNTQILQGKLKFMNLEGGCWYLQVPSNPGPLEDIAKFELLGLLKEKLEQYRDQEVEVRGRISEDMASICQIGTIFEVREIYSTAENESNQQSTIETSDWQTYRNEEFGFEVKYPSNWSIIGETTNEPAFSPDGKVKIYTRVHVSGTQEYIYSLAYREEQECPERIFKPGEPVVGPGAACPLVKSKETKEININGLSGYFKERESGSLSAYLPRTDKKIAIEFTTRHPDYKDVFNQILSTFRFVE